MQVTVIQLIFSISFQLLQLFRFFKSLSGIFLCQLLRETLSKFLLVCTRMKSSTNPNKKKMQEIFVYLFSICMKEFQRNGMQILR